MALFPQEKDFFSKPQTGGGNYFWKFWFSQGGSGCTYLLV